VEASQSDRHKLWKNVDDLLGRGREPVSSAVDVEVFNQFFAEKVAKVRALLMHRRRRSPVRHLMSPIASSDR